MLHEMLGIVSTLQGSHLVNRLLKTGGSHESHLFSSDPEWVEPVDALYGSTPLGSWVGRVSSSTPHIWRYAVIEGSTPLGLSSWRCATGTSLRSMLLTIPILYREDEFAGQARKDTDSEQIGNGLSENRGKVMQENGVFVAQTNALVHKNGVENVFLGAILVCPEITRTFASGK